MNNMLSAYQKEVLPKLKEEFNIKNDFAVPGIEKIVLNMGAAEALSNKESMEKIKEQLSVISGQKPKVTIAKKSISTFKLKKGDEIGAMVTLRGRKAWDFLEKFISIVAPRIRDFRGFEKQKIDNKGNLSMGIKEQILFPQIDYSKVDKVRGLVVTIVITNGNPEKSKRLLELLGLPFRKEQ